MILKGTVSLDGSLTELEIIKKVKISKWLQIFFKLNLEKIFKDFIKLKLIGVSGTSGGLELEVNILKLQAEEVLLSVSKEKRNDLSLLWKIL